MHTKSPVASEFFEQLHAYRTAAAQRREELAAAIQSRYGAERTVLIGDMAGFTRRVMKEGIIHYLSLIGAMRALCAPVIERHGGYLFKADADNVFAAFVIPDQGIQTALELQREVQAMNEGCAAGDHIELELGLACGPVLAVGTDDVWGSPVNFAAKLGEDLAAAGEILAHESLEPELRRLRLPLDPLESEVSGQRLRYFRVGWR